MSIISPPMPGQGRLALPGEAATRQAVTMIAASIVAMALAFSVVNVTRLCLDLGVTAWIAWLIGPSVDLSVIGLLTGIRFLSLHEYTDERLAKLTRVLRFCGLLTLALNIAGALWRLQFGTAAVDAIGPVLLIIWSDIGPWLLREINTVSPAAPLPANSGRSQAGCAAAGPAVIPAVLLASARDLDAEHREATGRPISRDALRGRLQIGTDRASALVAAVRAEAAARIPSSQQQAA